MYMEAVTTRLEADGSEVLDVADRHLADVTLVYCDTAEDWELLADVLPNPAVAVLPSFDINGFIRALRQGAGVAHSATSSEMVVDAVEAAMHGEALLPIGLAQRLANQSTTSDEAHTFTEIEKLLISALARGKTTSEIVEEINYSDRTVRRRLQSLYLKLDVQSRGEAIEKIHLEGLDSQHHQ